VSSAFERASTVIRLRGAGEEGLGEDVVYDAVDHAILQGAGPTLPLAGSFTIASFAERLRELAAGRSSTSPRCSTPTPPTTWRRPASTCPTRSRGCLKARSHRRPHQLDFAGAERNFHPAARLRTP
jgi:hypothetical protein